MSINSGTRQNIAKDTEVIRTMTTKDAKCIGLSKM